MRTILTVLALIAITACTDGPTEPDTPSIDGKWSGVIEEATYTFDIAESRGVITGSYRIDHFDLPPSGLHDTLDSGTYDHPNITFSFGFHFEDAVSCTYQGEVANATSITGRLRCTEGEGDRTEQRPLALAKEGG